MLYIRNIHHMFHLMLATLLESFIFVVFQMLNKDKWYPRALRMHLI